MKKSKLQVIIDFISQMHRVRSDKKENSKNDHKSTAKKLSLFAILFICLQTSGFAITYFSRTSGNWNAPGSWSTVTYGNATNTGSFPVAGDIVNIGNGHTVYIASAAVCATLNVGQGVSGFLEYRSTLKSDFLKCAARPQQLHNETHNQKNKKPSQAIYHKYY